MSSVYSTATQAAIWAHSLCFGVSTTVPTLHADRLRTSERASWARGRKPGFCTLPVYVAAFCALGQALSPLGPEYPA